MKPLSLIVSRLRALRAARGPRGPSGSCSPRPSPCGADLLVLLLVPLLTVCSGCAADRDRREPRPPAHPPHAASDPHPRDSASPSASTWHYRMKANLDDRDFACDGAAVLRRAPHEPEARCWTWTLASIRCSGDREADWLHLHSDGGEICASAPGPASVPVPGSASASAPAPAWTLTSPSLPGRASCSVTAVADTPKVLQGFTLECSWQCRDPRYPCAGIASYHFHAP